MVSNDIIAGLEATKQQAKTSYYLGMSVAVVSILTGLFFTIYAGELSVFFQPYVKDVPESFIGLMLIFFGLFKIIGISFNNKIIRRISIIVLSFLWGSLFVVSTFYSFGVGFPSLSFIFAGKLTTDCLRVSTRGLYHK